MCTFIKSVGSIYISYAFAKGVDSVAFEFCTFYEVCTIYPKPSLTTEESKQLCSFNFFQETEQQQGYITTRPPIGWRCLYSHGAFLSCHGRFGPSLLCKIFELISEFLNFRAIEYPVWKIFELISEFNNFRITDYIVWMRNSGNSTHLANVEQDLFH